MRRCFILKITENINLITLLIFVYKMRDTYLISSQPTQFQPPWFSIFGRLSIRNPFSSAALCDDIYIKLMGAAQRGKSYDQKTGKKMDFTGVEIAWVEMKSNEYPFFIYEMDQRKKLNILGDFEN